MSFTPQDGFQRRAMVNHTLIQRPQNSRFTAQRNPHGPRPAPVVMRPAADYRNHEVVTIKLEGLDPTATTFSLWKGFHSQGDISFIEIYERDGNRDGYGKIRFSPPPRQEFWSRRLYTLTRDDGTQYCIRVRLEDARPPRGVQSPIKKHVFYKPLLKIKPWALDFGFMEEDGVMASLRKVPPKGNPHSSDDILFMVDLQKLRIVAKFKYEFKDPRHGGRRTDSRDQIGKHDRVNSYQMQIPFGQIKMIKKLDYQNKNFFRLLISLESPPQFYRKMQGADAGHAPESLMWTEWDTWYRQTDIVYNPFLLPTAKIALHKEQPEIDIGNDSHLNPTLRTLTRYPGRWTTYLFTIENSAAADEYVLMAEALSDFNIPIVNSDDVINWDPRPADLWDHLDPPSPESTADELQCLEASESSTFLPFEVRYQLEVCISREYLNERNITKVFVQTLAHLAHSDLTKARNVLEWVAENNKRIYDPMSIFENREALAFSPRTQIPNYCAYVRKATITPSTVYFSSPTVETTNRVLRRFARENHDGRFLRVQFTDEMAEVCPGFS